MISFYKCFPLSSRVLLASLPTSSLVLPKMNWVTLLCCWIKNVPPFPISNGLWASSLCQGLRYARTCTQILYDLHGKMKLAEKFILVWKNSWNPGIVFLNTHFPWTLWRALIYAHHTRMASLLFSIYSIYLYKGREKEKELHLLVHFPDVLYI